MGPQGGALAAVYRICSGRGKGFALRALHADSYTKASCALVLQAGAVVFSLHCGSVLSPDFTDAMGYSNSDNPYFIYCTEDMTRGAGYDGWWLASCGLSGGPWMRRVNSGQGRIISL